MRIKSIRKVNLEKPKKYYDVINANPYNNFLVKTTSGYVVSHNCFFDEVNFIRNMDIDKQKAKAIDMIDTAIGGMKTRFIKDGKNPTLLILASSKRSDKSFLEEHMKKKLQSEQENVIIIDEPVWKVKPAGTYSKETFKVALGNKFLVSMIIGNEEDEKPYLDKGYKIIHVPIDFRANFMDDIDRALCDYAGISSSELSKYISGAVVQANINPDRENPFQQDILEIGNAPDDRLQYYNFFDLEKIPPELRNKPLCIHLDMSISGDMTGIAGTFIAGKKPSTDNSQGSDLFYKLGFSVSIKAPKGRQISFEKNRNFIRWLRDKGLKIKEVTADTFQSYDLIQQLQAEGFKCSTLSVDRVDTDHICKPYQSFKSALYENRFELYHSKRLEDEITDLERNINTGKVDHPPNGCFTGDTKVSLTDGREISFLELIDEYNQGKTNYVYSINHDRKVIEPKRIVKAWCTLKDQHLVKITLDNGEEIRCTKNHLFMLRDGSYIEAQNLIPNDSLMPLYRKLPTKGKLIHYRMYYEPFEDQWHYEHRRFAINVLDDKEIVHHLDCNKSNNNPDNLLWVSRDQHQKIHAQIQTGAQSKEANSKRKKSLSNYYLNNRDNPIFIERNKKISQTLKDKDLDSSTAEERRIRDKEKEDRIKSIEDMFGVTYSELSVNDRVKLGLEYSKIIDPERYENMRRGTSEGLSRAHKRGEFINAEKALSDHNKKMSFLKELFPEIDHEKFKSLFGFDYNDLPSAKKGPWTNRYRQALYNIYNHKVVSIEFLEDREDVYDIEVEDNHNFALSSGVFVHNSKDVSDAVCGSMFTCSKYAEEYAYDYGETYKAVTTFNLATNTATVDQINKSFEDELKSMFTKDILNDVDYRKMGMIPPDRSNQFSDRIIII